MAWLRTDRPQNRPLSCLAGQLLLAFFGPEIRAWFGQAPLAKVFWLYGVLTSMVLAALFVAAMAMGRRGLEQVLLVVLCLYNAWLLPSVWRCARRAASPWQEIARLLTVAWAVNATLLAVFLEISILTGG
ncbi:MAG: hypothetical protein IT556_04965 [Acetobacteraceae bacterium]|nr:hypothetical protein [Acetobacteraceae bacterium]